MILCFSAKAITSLKNCRVATAAVGLFGVISQLTLQRTRDIHRHHNGNFNATMNTFFHEPAQALARNIVVIALGFVPMFFATLVPYVTVGAFFFAIMLISGGATFLIMPAVLSYFPAHVISGHRRHATGEGSLNEAAAAARR